MRVSSYTSISFLILAFTQLVQSLVIYDSHVASSCIYFLRKKSWDCSSMGGHMSSSTWKCQCLNIEWLGSITNCIYDYANSTEELDHGYRHIMKRCSVRAGTSYTLEDMEAYQSNATSYLEDANLFPKGTNVTHPLSIDDTTFEWWYTTFKDYNIWIAMCQRIGWACVGFWIGVFGLAGIYNYIGYRFVPFQKRQWISSYLINRHDWYLFGLSRLEALISFLFFVMIVLTSCINYSLELNSYLSTQYFLLLDLISFRTDIIAFSLMPVVYLMGIRNNPFQQFSLISHHTMIKFHKIVAILFFVLAVVHSVIWTQYANTTDGGGYSTWVVDQYFYWGVIGTIVAGLMVGFSIQFFRDMMYEAFLLFHQSFSILFIAAMWIHCETLGWMGWVYSMAAILVFDRVCRIIRVVQNGLANTVKLDIYAEDLIKIEFVEPIGMGFFPGCYVYLHFLSPAYLAWQSHPFSLVRSFKKSDRMVLYLKAKKGITRKLAKFNQGTMKVLIDGPYGKLPVDRDDKEFDKVVGIGGGLGVSSVLSFFNQRILKGGKNLGKYHLHWLVNDMKTIDMFKDNIEWLIKNNIKVDVYYTRYSNGHGSDSSSSESKNGGSGDSLKDETSNENSIGIININYGKPSIEEILPRQTASKRRIYSCGPESLLQSVRGQLSDYDDLVDENHTW